MDKTTKVPSLPNGRPESGAMQFGEDWPGVFIRGDDALIYARVLGAVLKYIPEDRWDVKSIMEGLHDTLTACSVGDTGWPPK